MFLLIKLLAIDAFGSMFRSSLYCQACMFLQLKQEAIDAHACAAMFWAKAGYRLRLHLPPAKAGGN
jgi:hypothetical protein